MHAPRADLKPLHLLLGQHEADIPFPRSKWLIADKPRLSLLGKGEEWSLKMAESSSPWRYAIMPIMQGLIDIVEDDFWTERIPLFTAQFPTYYQKLQQIHGRFHTSDEQYEASRYEIIPISDPHRRGEIFRYELSLKRDTMAFGC